MATVLKSMLHFTGLVVGTPVVMPHGLNWNGLAVIPDCIELDGDGYSVTADDTNVTVTRGASAAAAVNALCESWHTYERDFGPASVTALSPQPIIIQSGGSTGGGGGGAVAVDENGVLVVAAATTLNFTGPDVTVTDAGGGQADIAIASAIAVEDNGVGVVAAANTLNFTGAGVTVTDGGGGLADIAIPDTSGNRQTFIVSQQVGDTDTIAIDASRGFVARPGTNYAVQATLGANSTGVGIESIDPALFLTMQFTLVLTAAWAAGDSIMFTVEDITP